ncbi:MAG TPA: kelch repeat-containing protein, partial [Chloroflexota bacterium]|nr:kelch repeat-containing protein [Chloroflexota bacterium]
MRRRQVFLPIGSWGERWKDSIATKRTKNRGAVMMSLAHAIVRGGVRRVIVPLTAVMPIAAQAPTWSPLRQQPLTCTCAAYDIGRQRMVMVEANPGLAGTWELDGADPTGRWRRLDWPLVCTFNQPAMVYDQARRELVLFDGATTWCSDGTGWQQRQPAVSPPPRNRHAMSYDSGRQVVVLFGGSTPSSSQLDDTWEWNGVSWQQIATPLRPAARESALMAYDPLRQRTVLIGGAGPMYLYDTWLWDGIVWQQQACPAPPAPLSFYSAMAWFPPHNRMTVNDVTGTREWDGSNWVQMAYPTPTAWPMCYAPDQQRLLLCLPYMPLTPETWEWNGGQWSRRGVRGVATTPGPRIDPAIATDPARGNVVIFGGYDSTLAYGQVFNDTWVWQQRHWQWLTPATSPSARRGASMTYHPSTQRLVLFGGRDLQTNSDTWTWDGTNWTQQQPANSPLPRENAGMATDVLRDRIVLFGGTVPTSQPFNDTWEWDGSNW